MYIIPSVIVSTFGPHPATTCHDWGMQGHILRTLTTKNRKTWDYLNPSSAELFVIIFHQFPASYDEKYDDKVNYLHVQQII